jgi:dihydrofolate reductase
VDFHAPAAQRAGSVFSAMPVFKAIAAMSANRIIGRDGALPWRLPEDLKFFRAVTTGHPVIMGRKTWESRGRPLPGRRNIVLSRAMAALEGAQVVRSLEELDALGLEGDAFVIGGAEIYRLLLPRCAAVYLTVLTEDAEGDTAFPEFEPDFPRVSVVQSLPGVAEWRLYER